MKWYSIPDNDKLRPFTFIVGGRGIGKTYSAIDRALTQYPGHFLYLRNTKEQLKECCGTFGNPFKRWSIDHYRDIVMKAEKNHAVVYEYYQDGDSTSKRELGYGACLSCFEDLRSVDLSDVNFVIYEEFIEDRTLQFDQLKAFKSMYETVNRNRELFGEEPLKVVLLSNAQRLGNPILRGYNLIPIIEGMQKSGQKVWSSQDTRIELPFSEISEAKRNTALYRATAGSEYNSEALDNNFVNDSFTGVKKVNINEYSPLFAIDGIYIYKHKSDVFYYACSIPANNVHKYRSRDNYIVFYRLYGLQLKLAIGSDKIYFSDYSTKVDLLGLLKMLY